MVAASPSSIIALKLRFKRSKLSDSQWCSSLPLGKCGFKNRGRERKKTVRAHPNGSAELEAAKGSLVLAVIAKGSGFLDEAVLGAGEQAADILVVLGPYEQHQRRRQRRNRARREPPGRGGGGAGRYVLASVAAPAEVLPVVIGEGGGIATNDSPAESGGATTLKTAALAVLVEAVGGGGGGKDDFAQGGGTDSTVIAKALTEITKVISGKIK